MKPRNKPTCSNMRCLAPTSNSKMKLTATADTAAPLNSLSQLANDWVPPPARPVLVFILVAAGLAAGGWLFFQISKWLSASVKQKGNDVPPGLLVLLMVVALGGFAVALIGIYKQQWLAAVCLTIPVWCVHAGTAACKVQLFGRAGVKTDAMAVEAALGTESPGPESPDPGSSSGQTTPNVPPNNVVPFAPAPTAAAKRSGGGGA